MGITEPLGRCPRDVDLNQAPRKSCMRDLKRKFCPAFDQRIQEVGLMKKWLLLAFMFPVALSPSVSRAGPILDQALEVKGVTTTQSSPGCTGCSGVNFASSIGDIGQSFSGDAFSHSTAISFAGIGQLEGPSVSFSSSATWDISFRVNQPGLNFEVIFSFGYGGASYSQFDAAGQGNGFINLSLNGVTQLNDQRGSSCNTTVLICDNTNGNGNQGTLDIILKNLVVGSIIDIGGALSSNASASSGPCLSNVFCSEGLGVGVATTTFSVAAIPEPPILPLFGTGLLLVAFALRRAPA